MHTNKPQMYIQTCVNNFLWLKFNSESCFGNRNDLSSRSINEKQCNNIVVHELRMTAIRQQLQTMLVFGLVFCYTVTK